jgi:hypothetical protein
MASSEAPTGRPRGGKVVKVRGAARARAIELITNPRRQYGAFPTSPPYCRLRFLISFTVRALAAPPKYTFHGDGPRTDYPFRDRGRAVTDNLVRRGKVIGENLPRYSEIIGEKLPRENRGLPISYRVTRRAEVELKQKV